MQPRILIVYTGGTIGMTEDLSTGALVPFSFDHLMKNVPKIGRLGFNLDHVEMDPPIDSSNMNPACWARIASVIADRYEDFDGFVVLHGTDTMAYTASALSFMLSGLAKPVVLTGSQLPIGEIREDGTENLITALQIAAARTDAGEPMVQEVAISFGRHLWRGNRATKVSSTNFGAFQSFNYPPLADMDLHIVFRERLLARPARHARVAGGHDLIDHALLPALERIGVRGPIPPVARRPPIRHDERPRGARAVDARVGEVLVLLPLGREGLVVGPEVDVLRAGARRGPVLLREPVHLAAHLRDGGDPERVGGRRERLHSSRVTIAHGSVVGDLQHRNDARDELVGQEARPLPREPGPEVGRLPAPLVLLVGERSHGDGRGHEGEAGHAAPVRALVGANPHDAELDDAGVAERQRPRVADLDPVLRGNRPPLLVRGRGGYEAGDVRELLPGVLVEGARGDALGRALVLGRTRAPAVRDEHEQRRRQGDERDREEEGERREAPATATSHILSLLLRACAAGGAALPAPSVACQFRGSPPCRSGLSAFSMTSVS